MVKLIFRRRDHNMLLQWGVRVFPYNLGEPIVFIVSGIFCVESIFNTVSGKSHILQGWDESEPIILCIFLGGHKIPLACNDLHHCSMGISKCISAPSVHSMDIEFNTSYSFRGRFRKREEKLYQLVQKIIYLTP